MYESDVEILYWCLTGYRSITDAPIESQYAEKWYYYYYTNNNNKNYIIV